MASGQDLLRVALAQTNATVGDIDGNAARIAEQTAAARDAGAALVVFPELALSGYPPEDLLLKTTFLEEAYAALRELTARGSIVQSVRLSSNWGQRARMRPSWSTARL